MAMQQPPSPADLSVDGAFDGKPAQFISRYFRPCLGRVLLDADIESLELEAISDRQLEILINSDARAHPQPLFATPADGNI